MDETKITNEQLRAEMIKRHKDEVTQKIAGAVRAAGHTVEMNTAELSGRLFIYRVDGEFARVDVEEQRNRTTPWRQNGTGRLYVSVRAWETQTFPEPNAGFDFEKIAAAIIEQTARRKERDMALRSGEQARRTATEMAQRVNQTCNATRAGPWFEITQRPTVTLPSNITEEQAIKILRAAQEVLSPK